MHVSSLVENLGALVRADGWENVILGLGGTKDPSTATQFASRGQMSEGLLEALYIEDHFAARIVEAIVKDGMRPGWELSLPGDPAESAKARDAYAAWEDDRGIVAEFAQGACWGRVFGGALTWIGAEDGRAPSAELDESAIRTVGFFHTFDRRDVQVISYYGDPHHPKFRRPQRYRVHPQVSLGNAYGPALPAAPPAGGLILHESRCVTWGGQTTTDTRRMQLGGWDDSVLERCWDALRQAGEDYGAKSLLLGRVSQAIYKIRDLYKLIAGKQEEVLRRRMGLLEASRSRARAILLDMEEDFVNVTQPVAGIDSLIDKAILRVAAAACMPVAVLMGQSLSTVQGSGDSELEMWAQQVDGWRDLELRPRHERIARLALLAKDGPTGGREPDMWTVKYRPLRMPTPEQLANARLLQAQTDAIRIDKGLASPEAIALARFSPSSGNDLVLDEQELKQNLERRRELAKQPPKDNAELGTVGARATSAMDIVSRVATRQIPRESGKALLVEMFRLTPEVAETVLGPDGFRPAPSVEPGTPGPDPDPPVGEGAGAPQGLPGFNDGGDPRKEPQP